MENHRAIRIGMRLPPEEVIYFNRHSKLFFDLPKQASLHRFPPIPLSSWKFPKAAEMNSLFPPGNQEALSFDNDGDSNINNRIHEGISFWNSQFFTLTGRLYQKWDCLANR